MLWIYGNYKYLNLFKLYTSESDVYGRQILTYKVGSRIERAKITKYNIDPISWETRHLDDFTIFILKCIGLFSRFYNSLLYDFI